MPLMQKITFSYPGGKARLAPALVEMMPRTGGLYCEPFAGRGNVFFHAAQVLKFERWQLNDRKQAPFFRAIKRNGGNIPVPGSSERQDAHIYYRLIHDVVNSVRSPADVPTNPHPEVDAMDALEPFLSFNGVNYSRGATVQGRTIRIQRKLHLAQ
jgi:hypothetical protein